MLSNKQGKLVEAAEYKEKRDALQKEIDEMQS